MQRHLALLLYLFPLPKRRSPEEESAEVRLDRAQMRLKEIHARHREQAVIAITQKNNLQTQLDELRKTIENLQKKAELAVKRGNPELADKFLKEQQNFEQSLWSSEETLLQAEETAEQLKVAIARDVAEERQKVAQILALRMEWKQSEIQLAMEEELRQIGVWYLAQPHEPTIDRQTARELVFFLLLLIVGLLVWRLTAD